MKNEHLNYFSASEQSGMRRFGAWKTRVLRPLLALLTWCGFTADAISLLSLMLVFGIVWTLKEQPAVALCLLILAILLDGVDGALARYQQAASDRGALLDIVVDQTSLAIILLALIAFHRVPELWAAWYLVSYIVLIVFLVWLNALGSPVRIVFRSKYFFFALLFLDIFTGLKTLPPFLIIFAIYNTMICILLLRRLRCLI